MNTPQSGAYRWMIFKDGDSWVGVALEFNIVVTGEDPKVVEFELQEAVIGYLESAKKIKGFRTHQVNSILNQEAEKEYEDKWVRATQTATPGGNVLSPLSGIYKAGISSLATV
ncbi:MAG: hypothetical protein A3C06_01530 [Candidatus Taylorbacteria bacterium RIFCSPHIGHO2_02_FULL_46_13]|uniref:Uncharacterized protein n=1 Tax=Candidatus Taylorbacteria bacterium RIFCSPHIGHO2_02_FULL_46_13 TaxID=1802312 RepID=A0A1G2MSE1_9BACT|nr:MAG: hypothetical protein A3C06_01530 [Candidatus Taylorbacteria bacterium RIFCSPHIGHO2_02_FULL_46_13]